jgi:hypothetical protein
LEVLNSAIMAAPKKGITSKKSREAAAYSPVLVHDIIEASAMLMLQGTDGVDDTEVFLAMNEGFFDFTGGGNEFGDLGL